MMTEAEIQDQTTTPNPQEAVNNPTCTTPVYLPPTMWDGARITASFKCNEKLWKEWLLYTKQFYGSVCRPLEIMIATALGISNLKVYSSLSINIGEQHISRDIRSRRKMDPDEILPFEHDLNDAVEATYEKFKDSEHWPQHSHVLEFIREGWGLTGLEKVAVAERVYELIRGDRKKISEASK